MAKSSFNQGNAIMDQYYGYQQKNSNMNMIDIQMMTAGNNR